MTVSPAAMPRTSAPRRSHAPRAGDCRPRTVALRAPLAVFWIACAALQGCGARTRPVTPCIIPLVREKAAVVFLIEWEASGGPPYTPSPIYLLGGHQRVSAAMYALNYIIPTIDDVSLIGAMVSQTIRYGDVIPDVPDAADGPGWCAPATALGVPIAEGHGSEVIPYLTNELVPNGRGLVLADLPGVEGQLLATGGLHTPRFVILIDDGEHACPGPDDYTHITPSDSAAIESQLAALLAAGVRTIVIGMTPQDLSLDEFVVQQGFSVMNAEAQGGGVQRTDARPYLYYDFADSAAVSNVLQSTIVRPYYCTLYLRAAIANRSDVGLVDASGGRAPARDTTRANGWDWTDEAHGQITLFGPACEAAVASHEQFEIIDRGAVCSE